MRAVALVACLLIAMRAQAATFVVNDPSWAQDLVPGDGTCATAAGTCTLLAALAETGAAVAANGLDVRGSPGRCAQYGLRPGLSRGAG